MTIEVQENWHNFHSIITSNQDGIGTRNFMQHNYVFEYYLNFKPNFQKLQKWQMFLKKDSLKTHNHDPCFKRATQICFSCPQLLDGRELRAFLTEKMKKQIGWLCNVKWNLTQPFKSSAQLKVVPFLESADIMEQRNLVKFGNDEIEQAYARPILPSWKCLHNGIHKQGRFVKGMKMVSSLYPWLFIIQA